LEALLGSVAIVRVPWTPLLEQVLEATGGLLFAILRRVMYCRDSVVFLELMIRIRVVVVVVATRQVIIVDDDDDDFFVVVL
jgi:hypothetical protein